jgi:hypothetical protein
MHRRTLLATLAAGTAGLAGCSFAAGDQAGDPTEGPTNSQTPVDDRTPDDGTETPASDDPEDEPPEPPEPPENSAVIDLATAPRTYALRPTRFRTDDEASVALWFDRAATADHPARVRGWLRNANDFANTFRLEWIPVVGRTFARQPDGYTHEARLHAVPTANHPLTEGTPTLARTDDGIWYAEDGGPEVPATHRLAADEWIPVEYHLVGEEGAPGRPTGTYEFRGDGETVSVAVWDAESPGPDRDSRFAGRSLPAFEGDRTVAWYHEADENTVTYVQPSTERLELDGLVEFEAVNHSTESVGCGHWNLHKLVDGEWYHVAPTVHTADCRGLAPGQRKRWSLRAFNGEAVPVGSGCGCGSDGHTQGYLGGGEYAVVAGYGHPTDASAALVELVGDPVDIVPTDDARIERDGNRTVVTTDRHGDGDHPPDATVALTRADAADERLIAEQVMSDGGFSAQGRGLRNLLAAMTSDTERVVLRTDDHVADAAVGYDTRVRRFRVRGQAYEVSRPDPDT